MRQFGCTLCFDMSRALLISSVLLLTCQLLTAQEFKDAKFAFVYGDGVTELIPIHNASAILKHPNYDNNQQTIVYAHGYTANHTTEDSQMIANAYKLRGGRNILLLDWSVYSRGYYLRQAIPNTYKFGEFFGRILLKMSADGFNLRNFHLIGQSLGGQVIGIAGRSLIKNSRRTLKLPRLTALDPAGPGFYGFGSFFSQPISRNDADFVDVIHSDSTYFGAPQPTGTADFWPNLGRTQPGCPPGGWDIANIENFCSHDRGFKYFAESVRLADTRTFNSVKCSTLAAFYYGNDCNSTNTIFMGIDADPTATGNFFLQTNSISPFNRGSDGIVYKV